MPFYPGTTVLLPNLQTPTWAKVVLSASDFSAASTTATVNIDTYNAKVVMGVIVGVVTPFSGGAATEVQITLGTDLTSASELTSGCDVFAAAANDTQSTNTLQEVGLYAAEVITITATAVGDDLENLTDGQIEVWLLLASLGA